MQGPSFLEEPLLATVDSELARVTAALDGVTQSSLDPITRQKLILYTVRTFDVEDRVTTQWYLHGDVAPKGKQQNRSGNAALHLPTGVGSDIPTVEEIYDELTGASESYVRDALETDTFDWLESHYRTRDGPFRSVYLAALPVYAKLHRLRDAAMRREPAAVPDELPASVRESCGELNDALSRYSLFDGVQPYVTEFRRAVAPFLGWTERQEWDAESLAAHYDEFDAVYGLFYDGVWRACGQRTSYVTVEGPSADETRRRREREAADQRELFRAKLGNFQMSVDDVDVSAEADTDRLPDLGFDDHVENAGVEAEITDTELRRVPDDDPVFGVLE